jgi:hypothetical protein
MSVRLTSKDFVDALYRGLLDREPDGGGLDHHVSVLDASTSPTIAADMLRNFVASDEFRRRPPPPTCSSYSRPSRKAPTPHPRSHTSQAWGRTATPAPCSKPWA